MKLITFLQDQQERVGVLTADETAVRPLPYADMLALIEQADGLSAAVEAALTGCRFDRTQLRAALTGSPLPAQIALDLCALLEQQDF